MCPLGRRYAINWSPPDIPLSSDLRCRIRRWVKRAFQCFELGRENRKFHHEFNVELHGTDDDHELMARYNTRREASELAEFDRNVERLREAVHEASVNNRS